MQDLACRPLGTTRHGASSTRARAISSGATGFPSRTGTFRLRCMLGIADDDASAPHLALPGRHLRRVQQPLHAVSAAGERGGHRLHRLPRGSARDVEEWRLLEPPAVTGARRADGERLTGRRA